MKLKVENLELDILGQKVFRDKKRINLTPKEYHLLMLLMYYAGQVVTRTCILEKVWGYNFDPSYGSASNIIGVHMGNLRRKINKGFTPKLIRTVKGIGYQIRESGGVYNV